VFDGGTEVGLSVERSGGVDAFFVDKGCMCHACGEADDGVCGGGVGEFEWLWLLVNAVTATIAVVDILGFSCGSGAALGEGLGKCLGDGSSAFGVFLDLRFRRRILRKPFSCCLAAFRSGDLEGKYKCSGKCVVVGGTGIAIGDMGEIIIGVFCGIIRLLIR